MPGSLLRSCRNAVGLILLALVLAGTVLAGSPKPATAAGPVGYVRLAHLSPDTPDVDVYLSSKAGGAAKVFPGVGYGTVSAYLTLATGGYAVAMRAAGAKASDPAVLTTEVTVQSGRAYTVAGVGRHADLGLRVIDDDLSLPAAGQAKVRIVQASLKAPTLTVSIAGGSTIADQVAFATTTGYQQVRPGHYTLRMQGANGNPTGTLAVTLAAGDVYSLLVLDGAKGLTGELRTDAQRHGGVPAGPVETGAGGTATADHTPLLLGIGLLAALGIAGFAGYRWRVTAVRTTR